MTENNNNNKNADIELNENATDIEKIENRLDEMTNFINDSENKARSGTIPDLGNLDKEVADICEQAGKLNNSDAKQVGIKIQHMISAIEKFSSTLYEYQLRQIENDKN